MSRRSLIVAVLTVLVATGCSKASEPAQPAVPDPVVAPDGSKPQETTVVEQALTLKLPGGVVPAAYQQVRAEAALGAALDGAMIPALEQAGPPAQRIAGFLAARDAALAGWTAPPAPPSKATGPGADAPHPTRLAFDQVSTDVLRAFFIQLAEAVAAAGPKDAAVAAIADLEARARPAFAWDSGTAESVAVRVMLVRRALEQK